jgi:hypothetical protein
LTGIIDTGRLAIPAQVRDDRRFSLGLVGLLFELLLPVSLSAVALLVLAAHASYWNLRTPLGLGFFGCLLVVLSLVLSSSLDAWTLARRRGREPLLNRTGRRARRLKLLLGGLVIPLVALAAANLARLPDRRTPMAAAIDLSLAQPVSPREARLADAVLRARSPGAKVQGIRALQALASGEALEQLLRILRDDPDALHGGAGSRALSRALASFGAQARPALLRLAGEGRPAQRPAEAPAATTGDLVTCFSATELEELKRDVEQIADPAARAAEQARVLRANELLQATLGEADPRLCPGEGGLEGFVLGTLLQMDLKDDGETLAMARTVAGDAGRSEPVRGRALLLVAKLGDKGDLDTLYGQLDDPSPRLQARAMQAIAELQTRLSAAR